MLQFQKFRLNLALNCLVDAFCKLLNFVDSLDNVRLKIIDSLFLGHLGFLEVLHFLHNFNELQLILILSLYGLWFLFLRLRFILIDSLNLGVFTSLMLLGRRLFTCDSANWRNVVEFFFECRLLGGSDGFLIQIKFQRFT